MPRVAVVIPNWNGLEHLPECLQALRDQTFTDFETIVVDNGSSDDSVAYLQREWPDVSVVELGENKGFPGACNAGIASSSSEYIVLLNNDTGAEPDWLEKLTGAMDTEPSFGWATSKLVRFDEPDVVDSVGHVYSLWVGAAHNVGSGTAAQQYSQRDRVFGATAAASIYRRSLFDDIGVFDDEFFFIHEDTDLDLRANIAGHRCLFVPDAIVRHKRGASYEVDPQIHLMGVRNRIWATRSLPAFVLVLWISTKFLRAFRWIPARIFGRRTSKRTEASAWSDVPPGDVVRVTIDALRTLPRKRKEVRGTRRLNSVQFLRVLAQTTSSPRPEARSNQ